MAVPGSMCSQVPWSELCRLMDNIKGAAKKSKRSELLHNFMESYRVMLQKHRQRYPAAVSKRFL